MIVNWAVSELTTKVCNEGADTVIEGFEASCCVVKRRKLSEVVSDIRGNTLPNHILIDILDPALIVSALRKE